MAQTPQNPWKELVSDHKSLFHFRRSIPFDRKPGNAGLLSQDVSANPIVEWLCRWISIQLLGIVLVVDIVSDTDELAAVVGAGEQDDGDAEDLGVGNARGVWCVGFEDELVDADGDGAYKQGVEFLVELSPVEVRCGKIGCGVGLGRTRWQSRHRSTSILDLRSVSIDCFM